MNLYVAAINETIEYIECNIGESLQFFHMQAPFVPESQKALNEICSIVY